MSDLTDVELDLTVARVMGRADVEWRDEVLNICQSIRNRSTGEHAAWIPWHPSQGGAAAWEVLEWVLGQRLHVEMWRDRLDGCTVCWILDRTGNGRLVADGIGPADGPTDAVALCRAVVALGEAG